MNRERALKILMVLVGLFFLAGVYPLATSFRQADKWDGDEMMLSIYVTLGIFLLLAARNPSAHRSLIAFTIWSSFAHATVMVVQTFLSTSDRTHLLAGVLVFSIVGLALLVLAPAKPSGAQVSPAGA